jgi:hypothetical protein
MINMFSNSDEFKRLKDIVHEYERSYLVEKQWERIFTIFSEWERSLSGINSSLLSHKMYFLKVLFEEFPSLRINANKEILDNVFPDIARVGETIVIGQTETTSEHLYIVGREITIRGGLLLTLEREDKSRFTYEFLE